VYEISVSVDACVRAGTQADVLWVVGGAEEVGGDPNGALVLTAGGGRMGSLLAGALDDQAAGLTAGGIGSRLIELQVDTLGALVSGVPEGTGVRALLAPASDFPVDFWGRLWAGAPLCLVTHLNCDRITGIEYYEEAGVADLGEDVARLFSRGTTGSLVEADRVVTVLWPVPRLALVGGGPILGAVEQTAGPLGWQVLRFGRPDEAAPLLLGLGALDAVVVAGHDLTMAGNALSAALSGSAGYVGALGTVAMNRARLDWLSSRGVEGLDRVHGPAGLDLGARTPAEVALAVLAEALAVRSGHTGRSLRDLGNADSGLP